MPGYNNDEIAFLKDVLKGTRIRPDNMIELPLPITEDSPNFPINRTIALKRTENTLKNMRNKEPEFFKKNIERFAKNVDRQHPRFEPVPPHLQFNNDGHAYWILGRCVLRTSFRKIFGIAFFGCQM